LREYKSDNVRGNRAKVWSKGTPCKKDRITGVRMRNLRQPLNSILYTDSQTGYLRRAAAACSYRWNAPDSGTTPHWDRGQSPDAPDSGSGSSSRWDLPGGQTIRSYP